MTEPQRSTRDVFEDHVRLRAAGDLQSDLQRNYAEDVLLICEMGVFHGKDGVRKTADRLGDQLPDPQFEFLSKMVDGEYAFLIWSARSSKCRVDFGADSFLIRDGRIAVHTICYRLLDGSTD